MNKREDENLLHHAFKLINLKWQMEHYCKDRVRRKLFHFLTLLYNY